MCHPSLVAHVRCQVAWLARVVLGKTLDFPAMPLAPLPGQETKRAVPRSRELSVRLRKGNNNNEPKQKEKQRVVQEEKIAEDKGCNSPSLTKRKERGYTRTGYAHAHWRNRQS